MNLYGFESETEVSRDARGAKRYVDANLYVGCQLITERHTLTNANKYTTVQQVIRHGSGVTWES